MNHAHRAFSRAILLLAVVTLASLPLAAQTVTGTMRGTVTDRSGGALPGVTITIRNVETGLERVVVTSPDGSFNAPFLPIGRYNVNAELSGFGTTRRNNVRVELNQTVVQDFILDPAMQETVTVNAEAPRIDVTDGEIKQTMRAPEIMNLPSPSQTSFLRLASAFSGYQENPTSGQDNPTLSSGSSVNFNGAGTRGTTFQINGVNNDDSSENQHRQGVPLATIQSFQVLSNAYSAEFGRGYGAVVLVQTKSGTNDIDGEIYGYGQDNKYISRNVLQVSLAHGSHYRRQLGATAGFPIMRDKLFGYLNGDQVQDQGSVPGVTRGVFLPSDLDPAKRLTLGNDTPANRAWQDQILAHFPKVEPNAPNIAARAYQASITNDFPDRDYSGRLDYNMTMNNTFTGRYQKTHQLRTPGELIVGEAAVQDNRQSNFGFTWTNILTSNTVQEARYGLGIRSTNVNISTGNDTPVVRFSGTGVPTFTILGNAGAFPITRSQRDQQFVYNLSSARFTRHTLKGGVDLRRSALNDRADNFNRGFWSFGATCNGVNYGTGIAAFWAGCVSSFTIAYGPNYLENRLHEENAYVQDDWRPVESLTLNLGVRYENVAAPKETEDRIEYGFKGSDYVDPRLGFAYMPNWNRNRFFRAITGGGGKFSIRGGYGVYHGRIFQSVFSQGGASVRFNPPNAASLGFTNSTNLADPTNGFVFDPTKPLTQRVSLTIIDPNLQMPESRQWNLTFERQAFWNSRLRLSYIGTRGVNLLQYTPENLPVLPAPPGTQGAQWVVAKDWRCAGTTASNKTAACPNEVPIAANEVSIRVPRTNERRPDARYTTNLAVSNRAKSWYNAGQVEWETGLMHGFTGRATYTFSKAIDEGSEATFVGTGDVNFFSSYAPDNYMRGLSRFDTRHRFTLVGSYRFPWLQDRNDWVGTVLGGWTVSTLLRLASGSPFTIVDGGAPDVDFDGFGNLRPVCVDKNYCGGWHIHSRNTSKSKMPPSAFRHPVYGDTLADLIGRNTYYADGPRTLDAGIYKAFRTPVNTTFMLRLDCFNVFDRVTWWYPNNDFNSSTFGTLNQTNYSTRTWQLGFRLLF